MTHNPAAAHPRLMALIKGMEKIEQAAAPGPWRPGRSDMVSYRGHDGRCFKNVYCPNPPSARVDPVSGQVIPTAVCEAYENEHDAGNVDPRPNAALIALSRNALPPLLAFLRAQAEEAFAEWHKFHEQERIVRGLMRTECPGIDAAIHYEATAHHACCTTALAAAAGTPALALLAGELQKEMMG